MKQLISYPEELPFYPFLLILLEQLFFLIHIILINLIVGLAFVFLSSEIKHRKNLLSEEIRFFSRKIPVFFALGVNLAIPALLFLQVVYGPLFYTSSILIATHWMLVIPAVVVVYYLSYLISKRIMRATPSLGIQIFQVLVLIYIAFVLVSNLVLMENPEKWPAYFESSKGYYLPIGVTYLYFRYLHFLVASVAIAGLAISIYGAWIKNDVIQRKGLILFFYATLIQIGVGIGFMLSLPSEIRLVFLEGRSVVSLVFYLSLFFVLLSLGYSKRGQLKFTIFWVLLTLVGMVINRFHLRTLNLSGFYDFTGFSVKPQTEPFLVFVIILGLGLGVIYYMVKKALIKEEG